LGNDALDAAVRYPTPKAAVEAFKDIDDELSCKGQHVEATLHIAKKKSGLNPKPDFVLKRTTMGGVVLTATH
jgi:hypothetical protein